MLTYAEQVHVLFGSGVAAMGAVAWRSQRRPESPARLIWPAMCFMIGFFLFVPVDAGTSQYKPTGAWDTFLSVVPDSAAFWVQRWVRPLRHLHVIQHKLAGLLAMIAGVIEYGRASGRLTRPAWGRLLPGLSIVTGIALGVHGGSAEHLPMLVERFHHWLLGAGLVGAGVVWFLVQQGRLRAPAWRDVWPVTVMVVGLDLAIFYRIGRM